MLLTQPPRGKFALLSKPVNFLQVFSYFISSQFWSAYVPCDGQYKDALRRLIEQMDVIKRLVGKYPDQMFFATTSAGKLLN